MAGQFQHKAKAKRPAVSQPLNHGHAQIAKWFQTVQFRKTLFGGVDERDLWKKLAELNDLYDQALTAERARCDALLQTRSAPEGEWEEYT